MLNARPPVLDDQSQRWHRVVGWVPGWSSSYWESESNGRVGSGGLGGYDGEFRGGNMENHIEGLDGGEEEEPGARQNYSALGDLSEIGME